jgi:RNA polymerase sigma-54 factor
MLKQQLQLKLQQKLSPQQIQLMKLLQVPTAELEQRIKDEMQENPALEEGSDEEDTAADIDQEESDQEESDEFDLSDYFDEDDIPDYKTSTQNKGKDDEDKQTPLGQGYSFQDALYSQLTLLDIDEEEERLAEYLIGNLEDDGYLRRDLVSICNDLMFTANIEATLVELESALKVVQQLDPPGVGARDLKECLLLQLDRLVEKNNDQKLAVTILSKYFEEFTKKHYEKIAQRLALDIEDIKMAIQIILHLNPRPGNSLSDNGRSAQQVTPDFILSNENDELQIQLNGKNVPDLKISRGYKEMLEHYSKIAKKDAKQKEAVLFVKQKIDSAKWFIDAIQQRNHTLVICMEAIISLQKDFFLSGDEAKLKPMILKDVADKVGMDISTISRMANSKYIQTPFGTYLLKYFFSEGLTNDEGEESSSREIKQILKEAIEQEQKRKPLPDEKLMALLNEKGYNIARRTVAKYREQLGIPVARLRKEI